MKIYSDADCVLYTQYDIECAIRREPDFMHYVCDYISKNISKEELLSHVDADFMIDMEEKTIEEIINNDFYSHELDI